jgi:hypothetical protein
MRDLLTHAIGFHPEREARLAWNMETNNGNEAKVQSQSYEGLKTEMGARLGSIQNLFNRNGNFPDFEKLLNDIGRLISSALSNLRFNGLQFNGFRNNNQNFNNPQFNPLQDVKFLQELNRKDLTEEEAKDIEEKLKAYTEKEGNTALPYDKLFGGKLEQKKENSNFCYIVGPLLSLQNSPNCKQIMLNSVEEVKEGANVIGYRVTVPLGGGKNAKNKISISKAEVAKMGDYMEGDDGWKLLAAYYVKREFNGNVQKANSGGWANKVFDKLFGENAKTGVINKAPLTKDFFEKFDKRRDFATVGTPPTFQRQKFDDADSKPVTLQGNHAYAVVAVDKTRVTVEDPASKERTTFTIAQIQKYFTFLCISEVDFKKMSTKVA